MIAQNADSECDGLGQFGRCAADANAKRERLGLGEAAVEELCDRNIRLQMAQQTELTGTKGHRKP